jgi:hypothetical protein
MIYSVAVDLVALVRPDDLGVHSREVVVDGIFLYVGVALEVVRWAVVTLEMWSRSYGLEWWTYRCVHALSELHLELCAALDAVAG